MTGMNASVALASVKLIHPIYPTGMPSIPATGNYVSRPSDRHRVADGSAPITNISREWEERRERAKAVSMESVIARLGIKLKRVGAEWVGPCPHCGGDDRFAIHTKKQVFNCRGGGKGDVISLVMHVCGIDFRDAIEFLTDECIPAHRPHQAPAALRAAPSDDVDDTLARADALWRVAVPIAGTPGADWLASRGITLDDVPDHGGLRFHPACPYGPGRTAQAIVTRFTDIITGAPRGIHRRAITADIGPKTMALGPTAGAVVRLWPDEEVTQGLVIGEGIETVLAAATRVEHMGALLRPAWACTTAGILEEFPVLSGIETLTILADNDASGRGQEAAIRCTKRWMNAGRDAEILIPQILSCDFNDLVRQ